MMFHALSRSALALYTVALLGTAASSMPAQAAHKEARVRAKVVANRIVVLDK